MMDTLKVIPCGAHVGKLEIMKNPRFKSVIQNTLTIRPGNLY